MRHSLRTRLLFASTLTVAASVASGASALPALSQDNVQSTTALSVVDSVVSNHPARSRVELMASKPDGNDYARTVYVFPKNAQAEYNVTVVGLPQCEAIQRFADDRNILVSGVSELYKDGMRLALRATERLNAQGAFSKANDAAITLASQVDAELAGLEQTVATLTSAREGLVSMVRDRNEGAARKAITDKIAALEKEAKDGIPDTPQAKLLQMQIETLKAEIEALQAAIDEETDEDKIDQMETQLRAKRTDRRNKQKDLDTLAQDYRKAKGDEAKAVKANELDPYDAETKKSVDKIAAVDADIQKYQQKRIDTLLRQDYIAAKAKKRVNIDMLNQAIEEQGVLKKYINTFIDDAFVAIELNTLNYNDLVSQDMGIAQGPFPIFDQGINDLIARAGAGTRNMAVQAGGVYNLRWNAPSELDRDTDPVQIAVYRKVGNTFVNNPVPPREKKRGNTVIDILGNSAVVEEQVQEGTNEKGQTFSVAASRLNQAAPVVKVSLGMGAYCGNLRTEVVEDPSSAVEGGPEADPLVARIGRKKYTFVPADRSRPVMELSVSANYESPAWAPPSKAQCSIRSDNYTKFTQDIGSESSGFLFWRNEKQWNRATEDRFRGFGLDCKFQDASILQDEQARLAAQQMNEFVVAETLARFIRLAALSVPFKPATPEELAAYKQTHPDRSKWSPTLMGLCGGQPLCTFGVILWDNLEVFKKKTGTVDATQTQSFAIDTSFEQTGLVWRPFTLDSKITLRVPN